MQTEKSCGERLREWGRTGSVGNIKKQRKCGTGKKKASERIEGALAGTRKFIFTGRRLRSVS